MWDMKNFKGKMSDTWTAKLEYTEKHSLLSPLYQ